MSQVVPPGAPGPLTKVASGIRLEGQPFNMTPYRNDHLIYAAVAMFLGALLTYNKLSNDVPVYEALTKVCAQQTDKITVEPATKSLLVLRRYEKTRILTMTGAEAVLHGNSPGYAAASKAVVSRSNYCIYFDSSARTHTVYSVVSDEQVLMSYADVAEHRRFNVDGVFWVGIFLFFGVAPYQYLQHVKQKRRVNIPI